MEAVTGFLFLGSKTTRDYSHEIKRCLLLGRKAMILDCILQSRDITLPTKVAKGSQTIIKGMVFPVIMCGWESWTIKKAEC